MHTTTRLSIICIIAMMMIVQSPLLFAQEPVFKNYSSFDGLPSSEVYCVLQDSKGYMWFATDRGLARFDGYNFSTLTTAEGLADNVIFGLIEDEKKRIWYKSFSKIGYIYNNRPYAYPYSNVIKSYNIRDIIPSIAIDSNNALWINYID